MDGCDFEQKVLLGSMSCLLLLASIGLLHALLYQIYRSIKSIETQLRDFDYEDQQQQQQPPQHYLHHHPEEEEEDELDRPPHYSNVVKFDFIDVPAAPIATNNNHANHAASAPT
jgi:hypothetical protein